MEDFEILQCSALENLNALCFHAIYKLPTPTIKLSYSSLHAVCVSSK